MADEQQEPPDDSAAPPPAENGDEATTPAAVIEEEVAVPSAEAESNDGPAADDNMSTTEEAPPPPAKEAEEAVVASSVEAPEIGDEAKGAFRDRAHVVCLLFCCTDASAGEEAVGEEGRGQQLMADEVRRATGGQRSMEFLSFLHVGVRTRVSPLTQVAQNEAATEDLKAASAIVDSWAAEPEPLLKGEQNLMGAEDVASQVQ